MSRTMILDHLVGVEDVGANLVAPLWRNKLTAQPHLFLAPLCHLPLDEPRHQDPHCDFSIPSLRALVLNANHESGGDMRQSHCRLVLLDVLPARTAAAEGVHAQIFRG